MYNNMYVCMAMYVCILCINMAYKLNNGNMAYIYVSNNMYNINILCINNITSTCIIIIICMYNMYNITMYVCMYVCMYQHVIFDMAYNII
jgi:hypothetical protein